MTPLENRARAYHQNPNQQNRAILTHLITHLYLKKLLRYARKILPPEAYENAGEVVWDSISDLLSKNNFPIGAFERRLFTKTRYTALEKRREPVRKRQMHYEIAMPHIDTKREYSHPFHTNDPAKIVELQDLVRYVERKIALLPQRQQQIYKMHLIQEKPQEEVAKLLGVCISTVSQNVSKIRKHLRTVCTEI